MRKFGQSASGYMVAGVGCASGTRGSGARMPLRRATRATCRNGSNQLSGQVVATEETGEVLDTIRQSAVRRDLDASPCSYRDLLTQIKLCRNCGDAHYITGSVGLTCKFWEVSSGICPCTVTLARCPTDASITLETAW